MRNVYRLLPFALLIALGASAQAVAVTTKPAQLSGVGNLACVSENFDGVTAPALPVNWTTAVIGSATTSPWATNAVGYTDTGVNAAFLDDANDYADASLYSPVYYVVATTTASVTFQQSYFLWAPDASAVANGAYNGAVLEVSINSGAYVDVVAAGGSFTSGGYNMNLDPGDENPIDQPPSSRPVWSGDSGGFTTTTATLPPSATGGTIQFRWRLGTEGGSRSYDTHSGWWVDSFQGQGLSNASDRIFGNGFDAGCGP